MPQQIAIRRGGPDDAGLIEALAGVIWRDCYPGIISSGQIEYMLGRMYDVEVLRREMREGIAFFAAEAGEELVGFSSCGPAVEEETYKLHKLYVRREWHRQGVGGALLREAEQFARLSGARALVLNVNKRNEGAILAYRKQGFEVAESVVVDIGNGFEMDDYLMRKTLE